MIDKRHINDHMSKSNCYKCGESLENAKLTPISDINIAMVAHVVCSKCQAESMVTITYGGSGSVPIVSDLTGEEIKKFLGAKSVDYNEVLDLHELLKKKSIWKLLQKKEKN